MLFIYLAKKVFFFLEQKVLLLSLKCSGVFCTSSDWNTQPSFVTSSFAQPRPPRWLLLEVTCSSMPGKKALPLHSVAAFP